MTPAQTIHDCYHATELADISRQWSQVAAMVQRLNARAAELEARRLQAIETESELLGLMSARELAFPEEGVLKRAWQAIRPASVNPPEAQL